MTFYLKSHRFAEQQLKHSRRSQQQSKVLSLTQPHCSRMQFAFVFLFGLGWFFLANVLFFPLYILQFSLCMFLSPVFSLRFLYTLYTHFFLSIQRFWFHKYINQDQTHLMCSSLYIITHFFLHFFFISFCFAFFSYHGFCYMLKHIRILYILIE